MTHKGATMPLRYELRHERRLRLAKARVRSTYEQGVTHPRGRRFYEAACAARGIVPNYYALTAAERLRWELTGED